MRKNCKISKIYFIYSIEYDEYDEVYGHSVDDESGLSPTDAQQWMYDRNRGQQSIASFITDNQDIKEETDEDMADQLHSKLRRDSDVCIEFHGLRFDIRDFDI